jgi:D-alanine-D-alanine ligase
MKLKRSNICVFFGGQSAEHAISIITGFQVLSFIDYSKYTVVAVYVNRQNLLFTRILQAAPDIKVTDAVIAHLRPTQIIHNIDGAFLRQSFAKKIKIDCALLAFHGGSGESGHFQGYLEVLNIPFTGCGVLSSALCFDKSLMQTVLKQAKIVTTAGAVVHIEKNANFSEIVAQYICQFSYPIFVKPANGGSSIGVSKVYNDTAFVQAIEVAAAFDSTIMIEPAYIHDAEINIAAFGASSGEIILSHAEEVYSTGEFLDFANKYQTKTSGMLATKRQLPAQLSTTLLQQISNTAIAAFRALKCDGAVRLDFLVNKATEEFALIEVNSIPGSFAYYLWEASGINPSELIDKLISLALLTHAAKQQRAQA